jgi:hypothetical protein
MNKKQRKAFKQLLCSLPYTYYSAMEIWKYYNSICGKYIHLMIESPEQIMSYAIMKQTSEKGKLAWSCKIIDGKFCVAYKKHAPCFASEYVYSGTPIVV